MDQLVDEPVPDGGKTIAIIYNVKKGLQTIVPDEEAEYDSIDTVYAIKSALESKNHSVVLLEADENLPNNLQNIKFDIAFNIAEGRFGCGREGQVPAILNYYKIPFTGSDETTLCIALDKAITKRLLSTYKIPTPKYALFSKDSIKSKISLKYPVIVKPNAEGSSKGISDTCIVKSKKELNHLVRKNLELYQSEMIVEEYIKGREFTVAVLGNGENIKIFPPMEIVVKKSTQDDYFVYSYNVKQNFNEYVYYQCPSTLTNKQETEMMNLSKIIYAALGCKDFSRVDFRMDKDGKIYFLEINPLPGLAPNYSDFIIILESCGYRYNDIINDILKAALTRLSI